MFNYYIGCGISDFDVNDVSRYNFDFSDQETYLRDYVEKHNFEDWLSSRPSDDTGAQEWKYVLGGYKRYFPDEKLSSYMIYPHMTIFYEPKIFPNILLFRTVKHEYNNTIADILMMQYQKRPPISFELSDKMLKETFHIDINRGDFIRTKMEYLNFFKNKNELDNLKFLLCIC